MTKAKETKEQNVQTVQETQAPQPTYGKAAFIDAAQDGKEKLILQVALADGQTYTREAAAEIVSAWKTREVQ